MGLLDYALHALEELSEDPSFGLPDLQPRPVASIPCPVATEATKATKAPDTAHRVPIEPERITQPAAIDPLALTDEERASFAFVARWNAAVVRNAGAPPDRARSSRGARP